MKTRPETGTRVTGTWGDAKGHTFIVDAAQWAGGKFITLVNEQTGERKPAYITDVNPIETDGHFPVARDVEGVGHVIGCECGANPRKRAQRISMQHTWHQTHRRTLHLARVDYVWPHAMQGMSVGGYL